MWKGTSPNEKLRHRAHTTADSRGLVVQYTLELTNRDLA